MLCGKCKRQIPDDSVFCHFCGYNLDAISVPPTKDCDSVLTNSDELKSVDGNENDLENEENITSGKFIENWLNIQAEETIRAASANEKDQPNNEEDKAFGLIPEMPIFTLATDSVAGEHAYLNKLYTLDGRKIKWIRLGSTSVDSIHGMIDIYNIYLESGDLYKTIYINMYGARESTSVPDGFSFNCNMDKVPVQPCATCEQECDVQSDNDNSTNVGKEKVKISRIVKKKLTDICIQKRKIPVISGTIIIVLLILLVMLYINSLALKKENKQMSETLAANDEYIMELEEDIDAWINARDSLVEECNYWKSEAKIASDELAIVENKVRFYDIYAVIVSDDGTNLYHRYGCAYLDTSYFWIYNVEAAVESGYIPCSYCN